MNQNITNSDVPMGLSMALAQNIQALERFSALSQREQQEIIAHTHTIQSKSEMQEFVRQISAGSYPGL